MQHINKFIMRILVISIFMMFVCLLNTKVEATGSGIGTFEYDITKEGSTGKVKAILVNEVDNATLTISGNGEMKDNPFSFLNFRGSKVTVSIENGVKNIGAETFFDFTELKSISIPNSVTSLGDSTFENCTNLEKIVFSDNIESIGKKAFKKCSNLTNLTVPTNVTVIDDETFRECSKLVNITLPKKLEKIGGASFYEDKELSEILIPSGVVQIGDFAFYRCESLTSIDIPSSVEKIDRNAFYKCHELNYINVDNDNLNYSSNEGILFNKDKTILIRYPEKKSDTIYVVPGSIKKIDEVAFESCKNLKKIIIEEGVEEISQGAFAICNNLESVILPESISKMEDKIFEYSGENLVVYSKKDSEASNYVEEKNVNHKNYYDYEVVSDETYQVIAIILENRTMEFIGSGKVRTGSIFFNSDNAELITNINIANGIENISGKNLIKMCNLKSISVKGDNEYYTVKDEALFNKDKTKLIKLPQKSTYGIFKVPDTVETIGEYAFAGCTSLGIVTIPDSVKCIEEGSFYGCTSLGFITIPNSITSIAAGTFYNCTNLGIVVIPDSINEIGKDAFKGCDNVEIHCNEGSVAEKYAKENKLSVVINSRNEVTQDTTSPEVTVSYSTESQTTDPVTVTLTANEELQELSGWTLSTDKKKLTKSFSKNVEQVVKVKDLAGNETEVTIKIANITETEDPDPDDPSKNNTTGNNTTGNNTTGNNTTGSGTTGNNRITATNQTSKNAALNTVDSKSSSILPKTGLGKVSFIVAIIGIISSISFYVKYKKMY